MKVTSSELSNLFQLLQKNTKLHKLLINFSNDKKLVDDLLLSDFTSTLEYNLEEINVNLSNSPKFSDIGLNEFNNAIISLKSLKRIMISAQACPQISPNAIFGVFSMIENWPELIEMKIECFVNNYLLLKENLLLEINLKGNNFLTGFQELGKGINKLEKLEKLEIRLSHSLVSDDALRDILQSIESKFDHLQSLALFLNECKMLKQGIGKNIGAFLKTRNFLNLETLALCLPEKTTSECLEQISKFLPKSIKRLTFEVYGSKESLTDGLQYFVNSINKVSHPNLREITLGFADCAKFSENEASKLNQLILNNSAITALDIILYNCQKLGDTATEELLSSISSKKLPNLSKLSLKFLFNSQMSDKSCFSLSNMISRIPTVKDLTLQLESSKIISNFGISLLSNGLTGWNLPKIEKLSFLAKNLAKINDFAVKDVTLAISTMKCLQELEFIFIDPNITSKGERCVIVYLSDLRLKKINVEVPIQDRNKFGNSYIKAFAEKINGNGKN